jgi:hypothetical protein
MHAFWALLFVPPTVWLAINLTPFRLRMIGILAFWFGALGMSVVVGHGLMGWLNLYDGIWRYACYRAMYVAVTATDAPFGQLALAGVVCWVIGRQKTSEPATVQLEDSSQPLGDSITSRILD